MSDNQKIKALTEWILANPRLSEFKENPEEKAEALIGLNMTVTPEKLQSKIKEALECCKNGSKTKDSIVKNICDWMNKDASTLDMKCKIFSKILSSSDPEEGWEQARAILTKNIGMWLPLSPIPKSKNEEIKAYKTKVFSENDVLPGIQVCLWSISDEIRNNVLPFAEDWRFPYYILFDNHVLQHVNILVQAMKEIKSVTISETSLIQAKNFIPAEYKYKPEDDYCNLNFLQGDLWELLIESDTIFPTDRISKQEIKQINIIPYLTDEDLDYFLPTILGDCEEEPMIEYPERGVFFKTLKKKIDKHRTIKLKFSEVPLELKDKVPHIAPMLLRVLLNSIMIAFHKRSFYLPIKKSDQLDLMGLKGKGEQFEQLINCHETLYNLDIIIEDSKNPEWSLRKRFYTDLEYNKGKGQYIEIFLNPRAFPLLEKFFDTPSKLPGKYKSLPAFLGREKYPRREGKFIIYLSKYRGFKKSFSIKLSTLFKRLDMYYPEFQKDGLRRSIPKLESCLEFARDHRALRKWYFIPSKEMETILENLKSVCPPDQVKEKGPLFLHNRLKDIHKKHKDIVKLLEEKKDIKIPKKLDPFDVYHDWKIMFYFGDWKQESLFKKISSSGEGGE